MTPSDRKTIAETIRGLLGVVDVAMPAKLQAQDPRVRAGRQLLAELEGRDMDRVWEEMEAALPDLLKGSVRVQMLDTPEAREVIRRLDAAAARVPNTGKR